MLACFNHKEAIFMELVDLLLGEMVHLFLSLHDSVLC